jgi:hypothetical protein
MHVVTAEEKKKKGFLGAPTCTGYQIMFSFHYKNFANAFCPILIGLVFL